MNKGIDRPWWWPFGGKHRRAYLCEESMFRPSHNHRCEEDLAHGYRHVCVCGFRWAKATDTTEANVAAQEALQEALEANRKAREEFPVGILRRKPEVAS